MGIRKRGNIWYYRIELNGLKIDGSTHLQATEQNRATAIQVMEARKRELIAAGTKGPVTAIRFSDAWRAFLQSYAGEVKASSLARLAVSGASILHFFSPTALLNQITAGDVEDYKAWRRENGIKEVTIRHDLHALAPFFRYARKKRWLECDPLEDVKIPSDKDALRDNILSDQMERRYFAAAMKFPLLHDFARVLLNQGLRPEEAAQLRKVDVDLEAGTFRVMRSKTAAGRRTLVMTLETRQIFTARMSGDSQWIFPSPRGKGADVPVGRLNNAHDSVCAASGVNCTLYDMRHTFATRFAQSGADIPTLCRVLGHSNPRLVMRYVHPELEHVRKATGKFDAAQIERRGKETRQ